MKIKLTSIRSNLTLNPFSNKARYAIYASRKDFHVYSIYRGRKCEQRFHLGAEKNDKSENFWKIRFFGFGAFKFTFSIHFLSLFIFVVTRRAGWSHPNSKSNTVTGKSWKMRPATNWWSQGFQMKNKLTSIRSNFNLNPFPDKARAASYASRKNFHVYSIYLGRKCE